MDYVVKCFATREDADKLTQRFGGEIHDANDAASETAMQR
jgi:hypothetical protein